jgi:hypothetical protein
MLGSLKETASCNRNRIISQVEDSPLGREDGGAKRTQLRKWVPVRGAKLLPQLGVRGEGRIELGGDRAEDIAYCHSS